MSVTIHEITETITITKTRVCLGPDFDNAFFKDKFPLTESILKSEDFIQNYMIWFCRNKKAILRWYNTLIDFLYCELFSFHTYKYPLYKYNDKSRKNVYTYFLTKGQGISSEVEYEYSNLVKVLSFHKRPFQFYDMIMSTYALPMMKYRIEKVRSHTGIAWTCYRNAVNDIIKCLDKGIYFRMENMALRL